MAKKRNEDWRRWKGLYERTEMRFYAAVDIAKKADAENAMLIDAMRRAMSVLLDAFGKSSEFDRQRRKKRRKK